MSQTHYDSILDALLAKHSITQLPAMSALDHWSLEAVTERYPNTLFADECTKVIVRCGTDHYYVRSANDIFAIVENRGSVDAVVRAPNTQIHTVAKSITFNKIPELEHEPA